MKSLRVYADTSVFGGYWDDEFAAASRAFFEKVRKAEINLIVSETVLAELAEAPPAVQKIIPTLPPAAIEYVETDEEIIRLRDAYLKAGVVGPASARDAEHVANATIAKADFIVSWNFKHLVHYDKISGFQGVNLLLGYAPIRIFSPLEVI